jgi:hypothetical protein
LFKRASGFRNYGLAKGRKPLGCGSSAMKAELVKLRYFVGMTNE